jgi:hypothetical protein
MSGPLEDDCKSDDSVKNAMYVPPGSDNPDWSNDDDIISLSSNAMQ